MNKAGTEVKVNEIPKCDLCTEQAMYDSKIINGCWAYVCKKCFKKFGVGLGTGRGQKLILEKEVEQ